MSDIRAFVAVRRGGPRIFACGILQIGRRSAQFVHVLLRRAARVQDALALSTRIVDPSTADALLPTIADAIRTQPLGPVPRQRRVPLVLCTDRWIHPQW